MTPQCVNLSVADLDATERWYVTKLGFERVHRKRYDQMSLEIAFLRLGDFEVELIQFQKSTQTNRFRIHRGTRRFVASRTSVCV
jgi:catechol 2,3-dioxygenase-like lactoylglutathione lyase family enzyme